MYSTLSDLGAQCVVQQPHHMCSDVYVHRCHSPKIVFELQETGKWGKTPLTEGGFQKLRQN
jgi:hypothetical protein